MLTLVPRREQRFRPYS